MTDHEEKNPSSKSDKVYQIEVMALIGNFSYVFTFKVVRSTLHLKLEFSLPLRHNKFKKHTRWTLSKYFGN